MTETTADPSVEPPVEKVVKIRRRTIDVFLIWVGVVMTAVLIVAGFLLLWGYNFSSDYTEDELRAQNIAFPPAEALEAEGRDDLLQYAGEQVTTGKQAEAYASYIGGHLDNIGQGATYSDLGDPQRELRAELSGAIESGAPQDEIDAIQAELDQVSNQRDTLFKGETLRGLLLSVYAWSVIGSIAGWASLAAFIAAGVMLLLVILGVVHLVRNREPDPQLA